MLLPKLTMVDLSVLLPPHVVDCAAAWVMISRQMRSQAIARPQMPCKLGDTLQTPIKRPRHGKTDWLTPDDNAWMMG